MQPGMRNRLQNRRADLFNDQCRHLRGGLNHCVERIRAQRKRFHLDSRCGHCEPYPSRAFRVVDRPASASTLRSPTFRSKNALTATSIGAVRRVTACKKCWQGGEALLVSLSRRTVTYHRQGLARHPMAERGKSRSRLKTIGGVNDLTKFPTGFVRAKDACRDGPSVRRHLERLTGG